MERASLGTHNVEKNHEVKHPTRNWFNVCIMGLSHFMSDYYTAFLPVLLPILAVRFEISYAQAAAIFLVFSVAMNFAQPPIGLIADRRNLNYLLPISIFTGSLFACIVLLSPNIFVLMAIVLLCGVCSSGFHPVSAGILTRVIPQGRKGLGTSIYIAGGNIGFAIAPIIVAAYIEIVGENYLVLMIIPAIITTSLIVVRNLHCPNADTVSNTKTFNIREVIKSKQFIVLNSSIGLRSWVYCALIVFIPFIYHDKGYTSIEGASTLVILLLGCVAGGLICGAFTDKLGPKLVTITSYVVALISFIIFINHADISYISLISLFICGASLYGSTPSAIIWAQRIMPSNAAFAASMMLGFSFGAGYVLSLITGYFADIISLETSLLYSGVVAIILAFITILLIKEPSAESDNKIANIQEKLAKEMQE